MKLVLGSSSPRRAEVLRDAGISFEVRSPDVDEAQCPGESAQSMIARLAELKARTVAAQLERDGLVLGADTTVELNGEIFGKPNDLAHARKMLMALSGQVHNVHTGIFLLRLPDGEQRSAVETTCVAFAPITRGEIEDYLASGEPMGKAGAYAIQGRAGRYIPRIEGCYFNVVGLPLARLQVLLAELGWKSEL